MTIFVCENCHEIIESDNFVLTCPKCGKNLIALNKKDATILKIKQYIQSAEVEHGIMSDFEDVTKNPTYHVYPSSSEVFSYINKSSNFEKFYERIFETVDQYEKFILTPFDSSYILESKGLNRRIKASNEILKKIFFELGVTIDFEDVEEVKITQVLHSEIMPEFKVVTEEIIILLKQLIEKIKKFVISNNLYGDAYKIDFSLNDEKIEDEKVISYLEKTKENLKKINDKHYVLDFFSDGADELREMMKAFWKSLFDLMIRVKYKDTIFYIYNDEKIEDAVSCLSSIINNHYLGIKEQIESKNPFFTLDEDEVVKLYRKIIAIKIPNSINPDRNKEKALGKGEALLDELIGLDSIKESIQKIKAYMKVNKDNPKINIHMCFNGNPGTGKTEVARILAQIFYENKILPTNKVIETDRAGLVSQYVGETPLKTMSVINSAMGGVLFIDEAYSLIPDDFPGDYGYEAVATLIKAMEDYRGKFCVVLAGYKNPMEKMISSNPGFKSRIQFTLDFPNYSKEELESILNMMLEKKKYSITTDALNKILDITDIKRKDPNFANAREIRNILDQVIMCQNLRCLDSQNRELSLEDVDKYIKDNKINLPIGTSKTASDILTGEEELDALIGLDSVKKTIKKIKAYAKKNKNLDSFNMHMCFLGNPGTGKTEVARIISRILYEAGVLEEAKLIETDVNGLVGKFVGETGPKTKEKINEAMGGVLFIDEAYALSNNDASSMSKGYGDEAIAVLLKEMEDKRGQFCTILAGYEEPMKQMISSNPGFESRIQFTLRFPDYTREDLLQIANLFLKKKKYIITEEALSRILDITDIERKKANYANARNLRNILDQVILNQNLRTENLNNNNEIILEDVEDYIAEKGIDIPSKKELLDDHKIDIQKLISSYLQFNFTLDMNYIEDAVVSISGEGSQGTGFIISPDGYCLTCAHCIIGNGTSQQARVSLSIVGNQKIKIYNSFNVIKLDRENDIALLKIADQGIKYSFLPIKSDGEYLKPLDEFVMAGFPFGGESYQSISFTTGKVASVNMVGNRKTVFSDMFGKPGNSGSPVLDKNSKVIIGLFWGGISQPGTNEMIHCFTPYDVIWDFLK